MPDLMALRSKLGPGLRPVRQRIGFWGRARRRAHYLRDGIEGIASDLRSTPNQHVAILREFGAKVGNEVSVHGPIFIVNGEVNGARGFSNLTIGDRVHLGTAVLIDLAGAVVIEDEATISMRSSIITHMDVGPGPLREKRPRQQAPVRVGRGAYLGIGATVLHGVTVGAEATIGAHALVDRDVAPGATVLAPRARLVPSEAGPDTLNA